MALKLSLKPHERFIVGGAVIMNGNTKSEVIIENNVPVLREKDILREKDADTPCKRIYYMIQLMYVDDKDLPEKHNLYWTLVRDVVRAAPSTAGILDEIGKCILDNRYYSALKLARKLIRYEKETMDYARTRAQCI